MAISMAINTLQGQVIMNVSIIITNITTFAIMLHFIQQVIGLFIIALNNASFFERGLYLNPSLQKHKKSILILYFFLSRQLSRRAEP